MPSRELLEMKNLDISNTDETQSYSKETDMTAKKITKNEGFLNSIFK